MAEQQGAAMTTDRAEPRSDARPTNRFYIDTEFIERGHEHPIELISIAVVSSERLEFYAVVDDGWDPAHASDWVKANVLPHLGTGSRMRRADIAKELIRFCGEKPELWGYYADYDWVVLCQLFGAMIDLPKGWPMFCRDVIQLCKEMGNPQLPKQEHSVHNALADARHTRTMHEWLLTTGGKK